MSTSRPKRWRVRQPDPDRIRLLADAVRISPVIAALLVNRRLVEPEDVQRFLSPRLQNLIDPRKMAGVEEAVDLILHALTHDEKICVYGDYDVDGMTSASTLFLFLKECGHDVHVFLPNRFTDGYGLNTDRIRDLVAEGTQLFISVDCGITAYEPIETARALGAKVIVVDHHQLPQGPLPDANAIINPLRPDCEYPFKSMCAAGLTFHLVLALRARMRTAGWFLNRHEPDVRHLLDIVAIGTVADVVPLQGINRILVTNGLARIKESPHPGVRALLAVAAPNRRLTASTLGFQIGPRLNAAGRLSTPMKGFELLTTDDIDVAQRIAKDVDDENKRRRGVQDEIEKQAIEQAVNELGSDSDAYVLWSEHWHPGVAGIVASRVVEKFHRPAALIAVQDGVAKGSIRSIRGFDAVEGLRRCSDVLKQFGGHAHAAGVTLDPEKLPDFRKAFSNAAKSMTPSDMLEPRLDLDAEVIFSQIDWRLIDAIETLAPFGAGNREPRFFCRSVRVKDARTVGADGAHLRMVLDQDGHRFPAIAFGRGPDAPTLGQLIDIAFRPEVNEYKGQISLQLRIIDFRDEGVEVSPIPDSMD
ncbi:MAG: single-stranded-DNA-specific exonuclease RecJ [Myxococcota bacterium]|nr:single-stranded-DNA-specific exonuclease RecJ [Myxococcota bacterium]